MKWTCKRCKAINPESCYLCHCFGVDYLTLNDLEPVLPEKEKVKMKNRIVHKFNVWFICLGCNYRWFDYVCKDDDLMERECSKCGMKRSFPSFIPNNFYSEVEL